MTVYKCDRCGVECEPKSVAGYEFCERCRQRFVGFLNQRDFTSSDVLGVLIGREQYSPAEVMEILEGVVKQRNGKH